MEFTNFTIFKVFVIFEIEVEIKILTIKRTRSTLIHLISYISFYKIFLKNIIKENKEKDEKILNDAKSDPLFFQFLKFLWIMQLAYFVLVQRVEK